MLVTLKEMYWRALRELMTRPVNVTRPSGLVN